MDPRRQLLIECSGLGGAIFDFIQEDLFLKCMSTTPVYGPSLPYLDIYDDNQKFGHSMSIGRTAQIHDFHMLHVAAWPTGVKAWTRILGLINLPDLPAAQPNKILTQAGVLAATGKKLPAHLRNAHPGFKLGLRLILDCLLRTYLTNVLFPILTEDLGWLMAFADPSIRDANRKLHIIGHSAGSFTAMVLSDILQDPKFGPFFGCTRATAIAMPCRLFKTHYTQRTIHLYHVLEDELCVWRPTKEDLALLNFFFLHLPSSQYDPVSPLSRSEEKLYRSI